MCATTAASEGNAREPRRHITMLPVLQRACSPAVLLLLHPAFSRGQRRKKKHVLGRTLTKARRGHRLSGGKGQQVGKLGITPKLAL